MVVSKREGSLGLFEIILMGIGLSADAFSVTLSNMFIYKDLTRARKLAMPVFFGVFQGFMPILGYFVGGIAASFIERYAGIISFIILGFIGGKMIWDALHEDDLTKMGETLGYKVLILQAVATSIDAFAVGVSFRAEGSDIWLSSPLIALCTFICCLVALFLGRKFSEILGKRAQVIGGIILIAIGLKALFF
jgi:manganese efflux pump family protein